jgi:hypothetical protein
MNVLVTDHQGFPVGKPAGGARQLLGNGEFDEGHIRPSLVAEAGYLGCGNWDFGHEGTV